MTYKASVKRYIYVGNDLVNGCMKIAFMKNNMRIIITEKRIRFLVVLL